MFEGFSPETVDFLWGIRFNNRRDWFLAHKQEYQTTLYQPMKALAEELMPSFADLKVRVSRIYRDMRMHPPTPYKDSLWLCIGGAAENTLAQPCLCFEVRPEGYRYGFLFWGPRANAMEALRQKMSDHADEFLRLAEQAQKNSGIALEGSTYARPKPCADERLLPYFRLKNMSAIAERPADELMFSAALAEHVRQALLAWRPMYDFCRL